MFRLLVATLLMPSSLLLGLPTFDGPRTVVEAAPRPMHVIVSFAGLMIFSTAGSQYQLGILVDRNHKFEVTLDGKDATPTGISARDTWALSVGSTPHVEPTEVGHNKRYPDSQAGQYDLSWMINLDELHPGLRIKPGTLYPKIKLNNGTLFTMNKSEFMERFKGGNPKPENAEFGFFSETVALSVDVNPGETFTLAEDKIGGRAIITLPYSAFPPIHQVAIKNARLSHSMGSDFRVYYTAFTDSSGQMIGRDHQYDFNLKDQSMQGQQRSSPFNPAPRHLTSAETVRAFGKIGIKKKESQKEMELLTCCGYICNAVITSAPLQ